MHQTNELNLNDLTYHIFPPKRLAGSSFCKIHDDTFNFFVRRWEEAFEDTKDNAKPAPGWEDHFLKQDFVTAITNKNQVIAAHLYTIYDLNAASTKKSEYFSFIREETVLNLLKNGVNNVISMEYLCVDKTVHKNSLEVGIGKVIAALGARLCEDKGIDGALGTPIRNNRVDLMMTNVGGYIIQENFLKYGYKVDLLYIPTNPSEKSRDAKTREVVESLWNQRRDYTSEFYTKISA